MLVKGSLRYVFFYFCAFQQISCLPECAAAEFLSTKFDQVSIRASPSNTSAVRFVLLKKNEPLKVLTSFGNWVKVVDCEGDSGWIHIGMLSSKRFLVAKPTKAAVPLHSKPNKESKVIAKLLNGVRCKLLLVEGNWCKLRAQSMAGWVLKNELWGI